MKHSPLLALALGLAVTASWAGETTQATSQEMQRCVTTERGKSHDPDDAVITKTCTSKLKLRNQQSEARSLDQDSTATDKTSTTTYSTTRDSTTVEQSTPPK